MLSCCSSCSVGSSTAELFSKQLTPVELKEEEKKKEKKERRLFCLDPNTVTQNRAAPHPRNLKVILQTIIVNISLRALSLLSLYDPSVGPEVGGAEEEKEVG